MFRIKKADVRQAQEIAHIHAHSFDFPWDQVAIRGFIEDPSVLSYTALEAEGQKISAFILVRHVLDEADILTLAVSPKWLRRGLGYGLCHASLCYLSNNQVQKVHLEVSSDNIKAIALYKKLGFSQVGIRPNYYAGKGAGQQQDALRMTLNLASAPFQFEPASYLLDQF